MDKLDEMIGRALDEEDRELLARYGQQGYMAEALGLFRGPMGSVMKLVYASVLVAFAAAVYTFWRMVTSPEISATIHWGVGTIILVQMTTLAKSYLGSHMEANRTLREIKRLELQISLLRAGPGSP